MTPPQATVVERPEDHGLRWIDSRHGHARVLTLSGSLDEAGAARLLAHLHAVVQERPGQDTTVVLDLRQVHELEASALDSVLGTAGTAGLDLRVVAAPHPTLSTVQSQHKSSSVPLFPTPEAALAPELSEVQRLRTELEERRQQLAGQPAIEQAKGILMHNFGLTPDEAFALIRRVSQDTNLKVRAVAEQLLRRLTGRVTPQAAERVARVIEDLRRSARSAQ